MDSEHIKLGNLNKGKFLLGKFNLKDQELYYKFRLNSFVKENLRIKEEKRKREMCFEITGKGRKEGKVAGTLLGQKEKLDKFNFQNKILLEYSQICYTKEDNS